jgi:hypothetical protein
MAFMSALKEEMQQFTSLLKNATASRSTPLGDNFRKFGPSFGVYEYDDFVELAQKFYHEGMNTMDSMYSVISLSSGRTAIDFNGEIRAVYDKFGSPIAFFRPDYKQLGYSSKIQELQDFRDGKNIAYI